MKIVEKLLKAGTLISAIAFIGSTSIQIYARFFMDTAPSWTEEAARLFFVYTMSFGAGLAMKDREYVQLDIIYNRLSMKAKGVLDLAVSVSAVILFAVLGLYGIQYVSLGLNETSPSLGWSMGISFCSILVMSVGVAFYGLVDIKNLFQKRV